MKDEMVTMTKVGPLRFSDPAAVRTDDGPIYYRLCEVCGETAVDDSDEIYDWLEAREWWWDNVEQISVCSHCFDDYRKG